MQALEQCRSIWAFTLPSAPPPVSSSYRPSQSSASEDTSDYAPGLEPHFASSITSSSDLRGSAMVHQSGSNTYPLTYGSGWASASLAGANVRLPTRPSTASVPDAWPSERGETVGAETSPENTSEANDAEVPSLDQLKSRGKGRYTCPHGLECTKGGVQTNGELTVFERNSAFR